MNRLGKQKKSFMTNAVPRVPDHDISVGAKIVPRTYMEIDLEKNRKEVTTMADAENNNPAFIQDEILHDEESSEVYPTLEVVTENVEEVENVLDD